MRHRSKKITLDRNARQRKPLRRNLAVALIMNEKIVTTAAKAHAIRSMVERLVTTGKGANLNSRRKILSALNNAPAAHKLVTVLGPRYDKRPGGYLRVTKLTPRQGDNAARVIMEFVS